MQSKWDQKSSFVHRGAIIVENGDATLGLVSLYKILRVCKAGDTFVFHSQSSLPYLIAAYLASLFFGKLIKYVYDIHDLHESSATAGVFSRDNVRYLILGIFEYLVFRVHRIRKITVSIGLAIEMAKRYKCSRPSVVYNISSSNLQQRQRNQLDVKKPVVFFGTAERVPISLLPKLESSSFGLHIYGRGITIEWVKEVAGLKESKNIATFGEYNPKDMSFLQSYDYLLIYAPENYSLNFRYSMPNKLFQALAAGLTVLVSDNFHEMLSSFSDVTPAVIAVNDTNLMTVIDNIALKRTDKYFDTISSRLNILYEESKSSYCNVLFGSV